MKLLAILALAVLAASHLPAQTEAVIKTKATDALTESIVIPSGKSITINSGASIINNGTATGFGGGALDDLTDVTITSVATNDFFVKSAGDWVNMSRQTAINTLLASSGALVAGDIFWINSSGNAARLAGSNGYLNCFTDLGGNKVVQWATISTDLENAVTGILPVANGGTGQSTLDSWVTNTMLAGSIALSKLSITGTPNGTKFLRDDGSWQAAGSSDLASPGPIGGTTPSTGAFTKVNGLTFRAVDSAVSTYIGLDAGALALSTDTKNTAVGAYALATASGHGADACNVGFGFKALQLLTTGASNVALGTGAMLAETTGTNNTSVGHHTMLEANGADNNVVVGYRAADSLTTGDNNVAVGADALSNGAVTGSHNVAVGSESGLVITSGSQNVLVGPSTGKSITSGDNNICLGQLSGFSLTTASNNVCIGAFAGQSTTGSDGIYIGTQAGKNETAGNKLYIDSSSTSTPLIGGDFSANTVTIGGTLTVDGTMSLTGTAVSPSGALFLSPYSGASGAFVSMFNNVVGSLRTTFYDSHAYIWSSYQLLLANGRADSPDAGIKHGGTGIIKGTDGSTGYGFFEDLYRRKGSGSPEGAITAPVGCIYHRTDTGDVWRKTSGTGNTGWVTP